MTNVTSTTAPLNETPVDEHETDFVPAAEKIIRDKIIQTLTIWPRLSMSMLQVGIGTALTPKLWHPVMDRLLADGVVIKEEIRAKSTLGRDQTYVVVRLAELPPIPAPSEAIASTL